MKIIIASDKFKGSLTSFQAAAAIRKGILSVMPAAKIVELPMADGGDGFSAVLKHYLQTVTVRAATVDPLHRKIKGNYEWQPHRKTSHYRNGSCQRPGAAYERRKRSIANIYLRNRLIN